MNEIPDRPSLTELVRRAFPERPEDPPAERLWARIESRLEGPASGRGARWRRAFRGRSVRWAVAAAATGLVMAAGLVHFRPWAPGMETPAMRPAARHRIAEGLAEGRAESAALETWLAENRPDELAASAAALAALDAAIAQWRAAPAGGLATSERAARIEDYARWRREILAELARGRRPEAPAGGAEHPS